MATSLERRVQALEDAGGGGCPRCSVVVVVIVCGEFSSASRRGEPMSAEEYREFESEEEDGHCPVCGGRVVDINVGWGTAIDS